MATRRASWGIVVAITCLLVAGCAPPITPVTGDSSAPKTSPLEGRLWQLESIIIQGEARPVDPWPPVTAWFEEGAVGGRTGCNYYGGPYEWEGERLTFADGGPTMTAQGCEGIVGEQEALFMAALWAAEGFTIVEEQLTINSPEGDLLFRAQPEAAGDENAVYAALLREWGASNQVVLLDETRVNAPGIGLKATLDAVQRQLATFGQGDGGMTLDDDALADFREKNSSPTQLEPIVDLPIATVFLSQEEIDALFLEGDEAGWATFQEQYPGTLGIFSLSRVGFNEAGDRALAHMGLRSPNDTGHFYSLLSLNSGIWSASLSFRLESR